MQALPHGFNLVIRQGPSLAVGANQRKHTRHCEHPTSVRRSNACKNVVGKNRKIQNCRLPPLPPARRSIQWKKCLNLPFKKQTVYLLLMTRHGEEGEQGAPRLRGIERSKTIGASVVAGNRKNRDGIERQSFAFL